MLFFLPSFMGWILLLGKPCTRVLSSLDNYFSTRTRIYDELLNQVS